MIPFSGAGSRYPLYLFLSLALSLQKKKDAAAIGAKMTACHSAVPGKCKVCFMFAAGGQWSIVRLVLFTCGAKLTCRAKFAIHIVSSESAALANGQFSGRPE